MASKIIRTCDRCKRDIPAPKIYFDLEMSSRRSLGEGHKWELCRDCAAQLIRWVESAPAAPLPQPPV